eukprot:1529256-Pyramimonas_sp.AAC.1
MEGSGNRSRWRSSAALSPGGRPRSRDPRTVGTSRSPKAALARGREVRAAGPPRPQSVGTPRPSAPGTARGRKVRAAEAPQAL